MLNTESVEPMLRMDRLLPIDNTDLFDAMDFQERCDAVELIPAL